MPDTIKFVFVYKRCGCWFCWICRSEAQMLQDYASVIVDIYYRW